mmetsp:Transcript_47706/g.107502  ORF Transcript_47706/g.107502 Transcript_47706/m.107502 type:complete len:243 (+) Transcript_47706:360-1088(+)
MPTLTSAHMHLICACKPKRPASTGDGNLMANGVAGLRSDLAVAMDLEMDPVHRQQETCMYRSGDMPGRYARERCSGDIHGDAHDDAHGHAHSEAHMTTHMTMHMTILSSTSLQVFDRSGMCQVDVASVPLPWDVTGHQEDRQHALTRACVNQAGVIHVALPLRSQSLLALTLGDNASSHGSPPRGFCWPHGGPARSHRMQSPRADCVQSPRAASPSAPTAPSPPAGVTSLLGRFLLCAVVTC